MSTAARKARKRAHIKFERTQKVPTTTYVARTDRKRESTLARRASLAAIAALFGGSR